MVNYGDGGRWRWNVCVCGGGGVEGLTYLDSIVLVEMSELARLKALEQGQPTAPHPNFILNSSTHDKTCSEHVFDHFSKRMKNSTVCQISQSASPLRQVISTISQSVLNHCDKILRPFPKFLNAPYRREKKPQPFLKFLKAHYHCDK